MALVHRVLAVAAIATIASIAVSYGTETVRLYAMTSRIPDPPTVPCKQQSWVNADRACLTWTAPRKDKAGADQASKGDFVRAAAPRRLATNPENAIR